MKDVNDKLNITAVAANIKIIADTIIVLGNMDTLHELIVVNNGNNTQVWCATKPFMEKACTLGTEGDKMSVIIRTWNIVQIDIKRLVNEASRNPDLKDRYLGI